MRWLCLLVAACAGCGTEAAQDDMGGEEPILDFARAERPRDMVVVTDDANMSINNNDLVITDNQGPTIDIKSPLAGTFVGGIISVAVEVSDPSGIDPNGVIVTIGASDGNGGVNVPVTSGGQKDTWAGTVDTRLLAEQYVLPVISVRAMDMKGNVSTVGEEVIIDNVGPSIDLDPPPMHIIQKSLNKQSCSHPFDPVGDWAANDGDAVQQLQYIRARVEDNGNWAPGRKVEWDSLVRKGSVKLYIAPAALGPLLVEATPTNQKICNAINLKLAPVMKGDPNKATEVELAQLPVGGGADYTEILDLNKMATTDSVCDSLGLLIGDPLVLLHPKPVCKNDMLVHIGYSFNYLEPSIWSVPPIVAAPSPACEGLQFDFANSMLPEGPLCVAVIAMDNAGNQTASRPLRVCYDKGNGKCKAYHQPGGSPADFNQVPSCTDSCRSGYRNNVPDENGDYLLPHFLPGEIQVVEP